MSPQIETDPGKQLREVWIYLSPEEAQQLRQALDYWAEEDPVDPEWHWLPLSSLRAARPVLGNPANRHRAVPLTFEQFRYSFANAVSEEEAHELYETFAVPASGAPLFQAATANLNPRTDVKVDSNNPDRGPLLLISGEKDHTVPWALTNAAYKRQSRNTGLTEIVEMPSRGHALTIDHGWREVAETALRFIRRFA
jgi:non-heme chloroperoxidase